MSTERAPALVEIPHEIEETLEVLVDALDTLSVARSRLTDHLSEAARLEAEAAIDSAIEEVENAEETLTALLGGLSAKTEALAAHVKRYEAWAAQLKAMETEIYIRRHAHDRRAERLREHMTALLTCLPAGAVPIRTARFTIGLVRRKPSLRVLLEALIPVEFRKAPPLPEEMPVDLAAVKEAWEREGAAAFPEGAVALVDSPPTMQIRGV